MRASIGASSPAGRVARGTSSPSRHREGISGFTLWERRLGRPADARATEEAKRKTGRAGAARRSGKTGERSGARGRQESGAEGRKSEHLS